MKIDYTKAEQLYNGGKSYIEIGQILGVSISAISQGFAKRGILSKRAKTELKTPNAQNLAYYAGMFDGEGHITIAISQGKKQSSFWLQIGITNTFLSLIDELQKDFGIGHFSETSGNRTNVRFCKTWRCTSNQAMHVLKCLLPYLRVKKDQAKLAIEFQERLSSRTDTGNEWKREYKDKLLELKQATC
ncbi:MAG: hypothetical protein ACR2MG_10570 [Pyrinomonadaceae bacterium]